MNILRSIIFACLLPALAAAADTEPPPVALIGLAAPLTEPRGQGALNAAQLALDEINRNPVRIGGQLVRFEVWPQDDRSNDRMTAYVAQTFAQGHRVIGVIGHTLTSASVIAAPIYQEAGLAMVTPYAWGSVVMEPGRHAIFQAISNDRTGMATTATYLVRERGMKTFFLVDDGAVLGLSLSLAMAQGVTSAGGRVLSRSSVSSKTSDFNEVLRQIKQAAPDMVFFSGRVTQSNVFVRNLFRVGVQAPVLVTDAVVNAAYLESVGEMPDRLYAITPYFGNEDSPRYRELKRRYTARFDQPLEPPFALAYDVTYAIVAAARAANSLERDKIVEALHKIRYSGVTGEISFNADGTVAKPGYTLYQVKNQKWGMVKVLH